MLFLSLVLYEELNQSMEEMPEAMIGKGLETILRVRCMLQGTGG